MPSLTLEDGSSIHFETHGFDAENPAVVFLNGMSQTTQHWTSHARSLREHYRVVTYDALGQGKSDVPNEAPTIERHADDLLAILDELDLERVCLVGFSHGARVALGFAALHPDRVSGLALVSATARPTALARTIVRSWSEVLELGGLAAMAWSALPTILGTEFLEKNERLLSNIINASVQRNSPEGVRMLLEGLTNFPNLDELATRVRAPTLVIAGDQDLLVEPEGARKLASLCGGEYLEIVNTGHTIPIERPKEFREMVVDFLNRLP
ncbi:MAG: alpha/beta fold hydrolase [Bradymonadaceae bacterium]